MTEDLSPCAQDVVDTWSFESVPGRQLLVRADTADAETAADLCFSGSCEGDDPFAGDDQIDCSFPPPRFKCPSDEVDSLAALATCEVRVSVCSNACTSRVANYSLEVQIDGKSTELTLVGDDERDGPGVTIPSTTTSTTLTTTTTIPNGLSCPIDFRVTTSASLGSLQYDVDYAAADGYFAGSASNVDCTPLVGSLTGINDCDTPTGCSTRPFRTLRAALVSTTPIATPASVTRCTFKTTGSTPTADDFDITVTDASEPDLDPVTVTMVAQVGACMPDDVTTTTQPGATTTSTTTTTAGVPTSTTVSTSSSTSMP